MIITGQIKIMQEYMILLMIIHNVIWSNICENFMSDIQIILILHHLLPLRYFIWDSGIEF